MPAAKKKKVTKNNAKKRPSLYSPKISPGLIAIVAGSLILIGGLWVLLSQAATPFRHPGVLVSEQQLDFVKQKVSSGQEPWLTAFNRMRTSSLASKTYAPKPVTRLQCTTSGLLNAYQQIGCTDINNDSAAVYTQALMYKFTGDQAYANKAIQIMNSWSSTLKEVPLDDPNGSDPRNDAEFWQSRLILGWSAETMIRGAEIIRYSNAGWQPADIQRFESMLRNIYYPHLAQGWTGTNNAAASWASGLINMGVFLRDDAIYQKGIQHWKQNARSMVYLTRDGTRPQQYLSPRDNKLKTPNYWTVTTYINGLASETCRDLGHTFMGLGAMTNGAETALLHGRDDLYSDPEFKDRFVASYELNARYANELLDYMAANNVRDTSLFDDSPTSNPRNAALANWKPANFPCGDFKVGGASTYLGNEIAYNHFANRLGISMPNLKRLAERTRPQNGGNHLFYETLTHANTGNVGLLSPTPTTTITPTPTPTTTTTPTPTPDTTAPTGPSSLSASATSTSQINLSWPAATDSVGVTSYVLTRNGTQIYAGTALSFSDTGLTASTAYTYKVVARDAAGNTSTGTTTSATTQAAPTPTPTTTPTPTPTPDTTPPSAPTNARGKVEFDALRFTYFTNLSWAPSYDNIGVTSYEVKRNNTSLGTTTTPSFKDYSLQPNVLYTYDIYARDARGNTSLPGTARLTGRCFLIWCWSE